MSEIKENDVVKRMSPSGTHLVARVRWVNDKGEAGITYLSPEKWEGTAQVVDIEELEVVQNGMGDLTKTSTKELIAAITRLRGARLPKKLAVRGTSTRKKAAKSKLDAILAEGGGALDALLAQAAKEIKEEEEGGK